MKVDHIDIGMLREEFGNGCTEQDLRQTMGVPDAFPIRMKRLAKLIDIALKAADQDAVEDIWRDTPEDVKSLANRLFA